ncbi:MAG: aldose 1-epimerase [Bacteroidota bacterium]
MTKGFKLTKGMRGSHEELIFENHKGLRFSVIPTFGGRLNSLTLRTRKTNLDVLNGFDDPEEMVIDKLYKGAILFPFANRLDGGSYSFEGKSYQFPINEKEFNNALHGLMARSEFHVDKIACEKNKASVKLSYHYVDTDDYYPFPFTLHVSYKLNEKSRLKVKFEIKNDGVRNMPMTLGWHPYFKTTGWAKDVKLTLPILNQIEVDERLLPTDEVTELTRFRKSEAIGDSKLDTCYELVSSEWRTLLSSSVNDKIEIEMRADDNFQYMQLYQPPTNDSIAIEPMTANINALNSTQGLIILEPEGSFKSEIIIQPS